MSLLSPSSVAVIGASAQEGKVGHDILKNLLTQGYAGKVYPVNPKGGEILGAIAYVSVKDIPETPDLAVIVIPAKLVAAALTECGEKGIRNVIVISAGFGEVHTDEGAVLERVLIETAHAHGITLMGPNCLGLVRPGIKLNASFAKDLPPAGNIALISQSGATAVALMDAAPVYGLGLSLMASIGNKAVMDECDFLELALADDETDVIGFYLESIKDGQRFLQVARKAALQKPVILLKAGVSEHGRKAASSHTGALAGSDSAIDALCAQTGIYRARTSEEFFDLLSAFSTQPALPSDRIAVITNAGGPGILATDAAEMRGLQMPALSARITERLKPLLPASASTANPIDVIGDAGADRYEAAFDACQDDPNIDGIVVILTPQVMTPAADVARAIVSLSRKSPLMPVTACFMGGSGVAEAKTILHGGEIPCFDTPERAINAMAALRQRYPRGTEHEGPDAARAADAQELLKGKTGLLDEETTRALFALYDLPTPNQAVAATSEDAVRMAEHIGYPVIAKVSSPDIAHKTDVGGVKANLNNAAEVAIAYREIMASVREHKPEATVNGVLVQQFLPVGHEFIVGSVRDPSFGPLVMTGLGGIYTELFRDTAFRIAPVTEHEAYGMFTDLQSWKLLLGMRGAGQADIEGFAKLVSAVSRMACECPAIAELDINPVLVGEKGIIIADAKVILG